MINFNLNKGLILISNPRKQECYAAIPYRDKTSDVSVPLLSSLNQESDSRIEFSEMIEGQRKYFSVHVNDLKSLGITNKGLEIIRTAGSSEESRLKALQNELFPKPPIHCPNISNYCGTTDEIGKARSQELYQETTRQTIDTLVEILKGNHSPSEPDVNYETVLNRAAEARHQLAEAQNSNSSSVSFGGVKRDSAHPSPHITITSLQSKEYREYGKCLQRAIEQAIQEKTPDELRVGIVLENKSINDRLQSFVTIHQISAETLLNGLHSDMRIISAGLKLGAFDALSVSVTFQYLGRSIEATRYLMPIPIKDIETRNKMGNSGYSLLQREILPLIIHTDSEWFKDLEEVIKDQFNVCLLEEEDIDKLKEKMAVLRYLFAHATFYQRGSTAIAQWIETAIYKYHGFEFEYKYPEEEGVEGRPSGDLDAFVYLNPKDYIESYVSKAHLSRSMDISAL